MGINKGELLQLLISRLFSSRRLIVSLPLILVFPLILLAACSDASPAFGQYWRGRILDVNLVTMERTPELLYSTLDSEQATRHYRIAPSAEDLELVLLRVKVENHTATSAIVNIDSQAAEMRDFFQEKYFPLNASERVEEVGPPANPSDERCARAPANPGDEECFVFLWNASVDGVSKAFELQRDFGIDGWMVFEAPIDTKFREFRWRAGDTLSITF